jgi:hypothetical protein
MEEKFIPPENTDISVLKAPEGRIQAEQDLVNVTAWQTIVFKMLARTNKEARFISCDMTHTMELGNGPIDSINRFIVGHEPIGIQRSCVIAFFAPIFMANKPCVHFNAL